MTPTRVIGLVLSYSAANEWCAIAATGSAARVTARATVVVWRAPHHEFAGGNFHKLHTDGILQCSRLGYRGYLHHKTNGGNCQRANRDDSHVSSSTENFIYKVRGKK